MSHCSLRRNVVWEGETWTMSAAGAAAFCQVLLLVLVDRTEPHKSVIVMNRDGESFWDQLSIIGIHASAKNAKF